MSRILYLTFYFQPDLCAGSFRNTPLAQELAKMGESRDVVVDVVTTLPNRYNSFTVDARATEMSGNLSVFRIAIPRHKSGLFDQIVSFFYYYRGAMRHVKKHQYDLVFASSSRLFTAYLGYRVAKKRGLKLYLDVRDIFVDTIQEVLSSKTAKLLLMPVLKLIERLTFNYATHINLISPGFASYFEAYGRPNYSYFTNGIDPIFLEGNARESSPNQLRDEKIITYAGNIGEGQGLHKIIPQAAEILGPGYKFVVIGDGGARKKLEEEVALRNLTNVSLKPPTSREVLLQQYRQSDFLFIHLNDYKAFEKVLPSKVFELGVLGKPLIAGVGGFAYQFISDHLEGSILFNPGNFEHMTAQVLAYDQKNIGSLDRKAFISNFKREKINSDMAASILDYL